MQLTQPLSWLVAIGSLIPLAIIIVLWLRDDLSVNPIQEATLRTGHTALVLLVASLACTPIATITGWKLPLKAKRALGLFGFLYVVVHFGIFIYDNGLVNNAINVLSVYMATFEKPYALVGFTAFVLLIPLTITSTKGWQKRLGKRWRSLHKLTFLIVPLAIVHFGWSVKSLMGRPEPFVWGAVAILLLLVRVSAIRKWVAPFRGKLMTRYFQKPQPSP